MPQVKDVVNTDVLTVQESASVFDAAKVMNQQGPKGWIPVVRGERLVALLSDRAIVAKVVAEGRDPRSVRVDQAALYDISTIQADEDLEKALQRLPQRRPGVLLVVSENLRFVGTVSEEDIRQPVVDESDVDIIARTIYGEARSEDNDGRAAVGWSIVNRVAFAQAQGRYWWGNTIREVCLNPWQYSCWNSNDPNAELVKSVTPDNDPDYPAFKECLDIARGVISGEIPDLVDGATHYYADYIDPPDWVQGATYVTTIGVHHFYKDVS